MVGDRVEGGSRRGRGIKLPGLRPLRRPSPRSLTSWRDAPAAESWPAASEPRQAGPERLPLSCPSSVGFLSL